ncbi:hypothetical protein IQ241_13695 [Romeria aff. gracilis LEGE 07310]|uniref:Uncharacterized protein n=1 Tax=Vasconcelosia minhoensis LEGE 07310 TaxID=915328 RepID=A0A8J7AWC0_9CYAN|nr:hypothetical protein [Romeria gracilis]MBE9078333.1 hypothetical protein [Romeria aff. gracilis LEGE 07310]
MNHLVLSKLKWIKAVRDPNGWAYTRDRFQDSPHTIDHNYVTIFPLDFATNKAEMIEAADQIALVQNGKLTHLVEILDCEPYEGKQGFHRLCRVLWWRPDIADWTALPPQQDLLGFEPALPDDEAHQIDTLSGFAARWGENGRLAGFQSFFAERL